MYQSNPFDYITRIKKPNQSSDANLDYQEVKVPETATPVKLNIPEPEDSDENLFAPAVVDLDF